MDGIGMVYRFTPGIGNRYSMGFNDQEDSTVVSVRLEKDAGSPFVFVAVFIFLLCVILHLICSCGWVGDCFD